jgi:hypothetical protein
MALTRLSADSVRAEFSVRAGALAGRRVDQGAPRSRGEECRLQPDHGQGARPKGVRDIPDARRPCDRIKDLLHCMSPLAGRLRHRNFCRQLAVTAEQVALDGGTHVSLTQGNRNDCRSDILGNGSSCSNAVATSTEIGPFLENGRHFEMDADTVGCC